MMEEDNADFMYMDFCEAFDRVSHYPYLPTPPLGRDMTQGQFLSGV